MLTDEEKILNVIGCSKLQMGTIGYISEKTGLSEGTVRKTVKKMGLKKRGRYYYIPVKNDRKKTVGEKEWGCTTFIQKSAEKYE